MRRLLVLGVLAAAVAAPAARGGTIVDRAVASLGSDPVYVDPSARNLLNAPQEKSLERQITSAGSEPIYVAVLPAVAENEAGGSASGVLRAIHDQLGRAGTYAVVVGKHFRAGSTDLRSVRTLANDAFASHHSQGVAATLMDFVRRVEAARSPGGNGGGGGGGSSSGGWVIGVVLAALAVFVGLGFVRRRRRQSQQVAEVKAAAREDLVALADDVGRLEADVDAPGASPAAKAAYHKALECYSRAEERFDRARTPQDLEPVTAALEEGRYEMETAKAQLEGRDPPERRPPCFFDPRHGTSVRDVLWTPPWGEPKEVPACARCAVAVERGEDPEARHVLVGGRPTPFWNAPAYYGPWMGGYYGGFGGGGLLSGLLIGSLLGSAWSAPVAYADPGYYDTGGFDGGGDWGDGGGGDFGDGGGDFGDGDFGGGDFGGGGGGDF